MNGSVPRVIVFLLIWICASGCSSLNRTTTLSPDMAGNQFLELLVRNHSGYFDSILAHAEQFRLQMIYTRIDRDNNNKPAFTHYTYAARPGQYFYPASTVKLPIALLAIEKVRALKKQGVSKHTAMVTEAEYSGQTEVYNDPTSESGKPTLAHYIKKIFIASDNDASNRLYEFLGQDYLNSKIRNKGYRTAQIIHRLSLNLNEEENRQTNPVTFVSDSGKVILRLPGHRSGLHYADRQISIGNGLINQGQLVHQPFDFSRKNFVELQHLHLMLQSVLFPRSVPKRQRFQLAKEDREFVLKCMSQYPSETKYPTYDTSALWDASNKFLLWGAERRPLPTTIRIFNKIGGAYGFLTDVAYIVDFEKKVEFMLSATIYCNRDGVFNDDIYDYDTIGYPFLKHLGETVYRYELNRSRKHVPDLTAFKFEYEK